MPGALQRLLGLVLLVGAAASAHDAWSMRRDGVAVEGTVVGSEHEFEVRSDGLSFVHRPIIEFRVAGRPAPVRVRSGLWTAWRPPPPGAPIRMRYRPGAPEDARVDSVAQDVFLPVVLLVVGLAGLFGRLDRGADWVWFSRRWED